MTAQTNPSRTSEIDTIVERLQDMLASDLAATETLLIERAKSPVDVIPDLSGYIVSAGGKRLRPMITLAAAHACGGANPGTHALATAVEFIHTATLLHDDVVDDSDLRRGRKAAKNVWGNNASILVGDFLFARAFTLMVETGSLEILRILSDASSVIAEGEVHQLAAASRTDLPTEEYLAIIEAKTAALFEAAAEAGALSAGPDQLPSAVVDSLTLTSMQQQAARQQQQQHQQQRTIVTTTASSPVNSYQLPGLESVQQVDFTCSGSCDYQQGAAFAFVLGVDALGAVERDVDAARFQLWQGQNGDADVAAHGHG